MLKTKMEPSPNSDDIGGMNLKKELRPYARQLVTRLLDNGQLGRHGAKETRDSIKRLPKADVVSITKNLKKLCEDNNLPSTVGATTPSSSKPNVERVNLAQQAEELSSNDTEQSSPDSSDDTVTKDEVNQMIS